MWDSIGGWILSAFAGIAVGHLVRRITPFLMRMRETPGGPRTPFAEILGALLFLLLHASHLQGRLDGDHVFRWYLFASLLLAITSTDFRYKAIADRVTFPGTAAGLLLNTLWPAEIARFFSHEGILRTMGLDVGPLGGFVLALSGALVGFVLFEGMRRVMSALAGVEAMGMGDSKLLMMMGAFLGPQMALFSLLPGLLCGLLLGVIYTRVFRSPHFPFGPALALGGLLALLYSDLLLGGVEGFVRSAQSMGGPGLVVVQIVLLGTVVLLLLRVRRRAARYRKEIEEDYERIDRENRS